MKALCWHGHGDVRVDTVPDPKLKEPTDIIIKVTSSGICGSDLHLLDGYMPTMKSGDIMGHEPMGLVVEVGNAVKRLKKDDRVVVMGGIIEQPGTKLFAYTGGEPTIVWNGVTLKLNPGQ